MYWFCFNRMDPDLDPHVGTYWLCINLMDPDPDPHVSAFFSLTDPDPNVSALFKFCGSGSLFCLMNSDSAGIYNEEELKIKMFM